MKTVSKFRNTGFAMAAVLGIAVLASCNKDDDNATTATVEETEAVDAISSSLSADSNGMSKTIETTAAYAAEKNVYTDAPDLNCGQSYTTNYDENNASANYSYDYDFVRTAQLNCNGSIPNNFVVNMTFSGTYDTPRMASDDNATGNWTISGLSPIQSNATFNGSYVRNGTQVSKVRNMNTFASTLTYALDNIAVSKLDYHIVSGSASLTFVGISSTGTQFTYNGNVTFNGDGTATLVINGNSYTIVL